MPRAHKPLILICWIVGHDPLEDFEGKVFCDRCQRSMPGISAKETAAHRYFGDEGQRQLERERKENQ